MNFLNRIVVWVAFLFSVSAFCFSYLNWKKGNNLTEQNLAAVKIENVNLPSLKNMSDAMVLVAEKSIPSVVSVFTERVWKQRVFSPFESFFGDFFGERGLPQERQFKQRGLGSGVVVQKNGYILTNNHVVEDANTISVQFSDRTRATARVIGRDPRTDIAVIKVDNENLIPLELGNSDKLRVGEIVLAVGSPMSAGLAHTVTQGIVSAVGRANVGLAEYEDFIQTDAAINPGNSGGALVDLDGKLIGINTAIASQSGGSQGIGFAVPINMVTLVMDALIKNGKVLRAWSGILFQDITEEIANALKLKTEDGVIVSDVYRHGPGSKAGLRRGDILIELNKEKIISSSFLKNKIVLSKPGTVFRFKILREDKTMDLELVLEEAPSDPRSEGSE